MANMLVLVLLCTILIQMCYGREIVTGQKSQDLKKPLLTEQEVSYILNTRKGEAADPPKSISPCARAILSCCDEKVINSHCSEAMKCGAFFFDDNPCEDKFMADALKAAKIFYTQYVDE